MWRSSAESDALMRLLARGRGPMGTPTRSIASSAAKALAWDSPPQEDAHGIAVSLGYRGRRVDEPIDDATAKVLQGDRRPDSVAAGNACNLFLGLVCAGDELVCLRRGRHRFGTDLSGDISRRDEMRGTKP